MNLPKFIGTLAIGGAGGGLAGYWSEKQPFDSVWASLALIGAVLITVLTPSLWVNDYKPLHSYDFYCEKKGDR